VAVEASYASPAVPQSFVDDVAGELAARLESLGCFRTVVGAGRAGPPSVDFLLRVTVDALDERVVYETSVAGHSVAADREAPGRWVVELTASARAELLHLPGHERVRSARTYVEQRSGGSASGRDEGLGRERTRRLARQGLVRGTVAKICKGSRARLDREVLRARARSGGGAMAR
jgi:hypothetical protein